MHNYFLLRGRRAILREILAAWAALTAGSLVFGIIFAKFSPGGEGAALVTAAMVSIPVAVILLQAVRTGKLRFPEIAFPEGTRGRTLTTEESEGFEKFWNSLDPESREGLRWVTGMVAANALLEPRESPTIGSQERLLVPFGSNNENIEQYEERLLESGIWEVKFKLKGKPEERVILKMDRRRHLMSYALGSKENA